MNLQLLTRTEFFTQEDINTQDNGDYEGKILVLTKYRMDEFADKYQKPKYQLFVATGGFGCSPTAIGRAVYGLFLVDGEECRMNRGDFMGVLKNEVAYKLGYCPCGYGINDCNCHI